MKPYTRATALRPSPLFRPLFASSVINDPGQPYLLRRPMMMLVGIAVLSKLIPASGPVLLVLVALHALRGLRETVEACLLLFFLLLGNGSFTPSGLNIMRWVILFAGFTRLQLDDVLLNRVHRTPTSAFTWGLLSFVGVLGLMSVLSAWFPFLSLLKLASFFLGTYTVVTAFWRTQEYARYWRNWMYTLTAFLIGGSFLTLATGDAYIRTVRGMQGILTHPQVLGPVAATLAAWLLGGILTGRDRSTLSKLLVAGGLILVVLSGARTAGLSLAIGLAVAMLILVLRRERVLDFESLSLSSLLLLFTFAVGVVIMAAPQIQERATAFIFKGDEAESATELFEMSRGELMAVSMENFRQSPVTGIGFGTPSDLGQLDRRAESFLDIPFSASSEKGFMPTAVLEETGLVGAFLTIILLLIIIVPIFRFGSFGIIWSFMACLLTNVGAAILFSVGGLGFFVWLFFGFCLVQTTDPQHARFPTRRQRRPMPYTYHAYYGPSGA